MSQPSSFFRAYRGARFLRRRDDDVAAVGAAVRRVGHYAGAADGAARHPNARTADLAQLRPAFLRQGPGTVLENLDGGAGGDAEMQVKLAVEILEMGVAVDETRQDRQAARVDDFGLFRDGHLALLPTALNLPPSIMTTAFSTGGRPVPSISVPPFTTSNLPAISPAFFLVPIVILGSCAARSPDSICRPQRLALNCVLSTDSNEGPDGGPSLSLRTMMFPRRGAGTGERRADWPPGGQLFQQNCSALHIRRSIFGAALLRLAFAAECPR